MNVSMKNSTSQKDLFNDKAFDVTSVYFSKIIANELSEMTKKKRIDCMKDILGVLKTHVV